MTQIFHDAQVALQDCADPTTPTKRLSSNMKRSRTALTLPDHRVADWTSGPAAVLSAPSALTSVASGTGGSPHRRPPRERSGDSKHNVSHWLSDLVIEAEEPISGPGGVLCQAKTHTAVLAQPETRPWNSEGQNAKQPNPTTMCESDKENDLPAPRTPTSARRWDDKRAVSKARAGISLGSPGRFEDDSLSGSRTGAAAESTRRRKAASRFQRASAHIQPVDE